MFLIVLLRKLPEKLKWFDFFFQTWNNYWINYLPVSSIYKLPTTLVYKSRHTQKKKSKPTKNSLNSLDKGNTTYNYNTENEPDSQKTIIIKWIQKFPYTKLAALQFDAKGMCIRIATAC